jgi:hypothetical protein
VWITDLVLCQIDTYNYCEISNLTTHMKTIKNQRGPELVNASVPSATASPNVRGRLGRWTAGAIVMAAIVAGVVAEAHLRAAATAKIAWSQANILEFLQPNETRTVTVTFTSNQSISNASIFIAPALSAVLAASPATFSKVLRNQPYQLVLALRAGAASEVKFEGTIQIKGSVNSGTYAAPLETTIVVHNSPLPNDPGPANDLTLAGVDSDNDGIRDDVERYIVETYLNAPQTRAALTQYSIALQNVVLAGSDEVQARASWTESSAALYCLMYVTGGAIPADPIFKHLRTTILNTDQRIRAFLAAGQFAPVSSVSNQLNGPPDRRSFCTFNPDAVGG